MIKKKYPDAITVFVGPCIAKKDEIKDKSIEGNADYVLTIGEFRAMMRAKEIVFEPEENTSGIDQKAYPTLGMLYEERVNHLETLYIPFVDIEGEQSGAVEDDTEKPQITAYEVWKRGRAAGLVDTDTARAAFFTQNFADDYTLQLAPELYVKVDAANCRLKIAEKIGAGGLTSRCVTVTVMGEGEVLSDMAGKSADEKLTTEAEAILN